MRLSCCCVTSSLYALHKISRIISWQIREHSGLKSYENNLKTTFLRELLFFKKGLQKYIKISSCLMVSILLHLLSLEWICAVFLRLFEWHSDFNTNRKATMSFIAKSHGIEAYIFKAISNMVQGVTCMAETLVFTCMAPISLKKKLLIKKIKVNFTLSST